MRPRCVHKSRPLPGISLQTGYVAVADVAGYFARGPVCRAAVQTQFAIRCRPPGLHDAPTGRRDTRRRYPAVVRDEISGLLVAPGSPDALAGSHDSAADDAELAASMGKAGAESLSRRPRGDDVAGRVLQSLPATRNAELDVLLVGDAVEDGEREVVDVQQAHGTTVSGAGRREGRP